MNSAQNVSKKWLAKSGTNTRMDGQTDLTDPEHLRARVLDSSNADTGRRSLQNLSPKRPRIPVNIPVKEHLRLASVVALSSNGACGAKI